MSLGQYVGFRSPPNQMRQAAARRALARLRGVWPARGSEDTKFGVTMGPEVGHGASGVYAGVQA